MAKVMSSYVVIWRNASRYLAGPVKGLITKTSPLDSFNEDLRTAVTRSGSIYQLGQPLDTLPRVTFDGIMEIPLERHAFCSVMGTMQIIGWSSGGQAYQAQPVEMDLGSSLCRAVDGRIFRCLGRPEPVAAFSALCRLAPSIPIGNVELFGDVPPGLSQCVLWLRKEANGVMGTIELPPSRAYGAPSTVAPSTAVARR